MSLSKPQRGHQLVFKRKLSSGECENTSLPKRECNDHCYAKSTYESKKRVGKKTGCVKGCRKNSKGSMFTFPSVCKTVQKKQVPIPENVSR